MRRSENPISEKVKKTNNAGGRYKTNTSARSSDSIVQALSSGHNASWRARPKPWIGANTQLALTSTKKPQTMPAAIGINKSTNSEGNLNRGPNITSAPSPKSPAITNSDHFSE